ncbi:zinc ABC transporter substrate-binding protein, partial [Helicobacter pylori]|nr:zinc ABC transporter substrate-binding protein [Helicobacter pylori]
NMEDMDDDFGLRSCKHGKMHKHHKHGDKAKGSKGHDKEQGKKDHDHNDHGENEK